MDTKSQAQSNYLSNEYTNTVTQINLNKQLAINAIKIYFSIFIGLFAYTAFLLTTEINDKFYYGIFGVVLTLATCISGWVLIDYITSLIYKTILYYKHLYTLREFASKFFFENEYVKELIFNNKPSVITTARSKHLPIVFTIINLLLLCLIYFFLEQANFKFEIAMSITNFILLVFSLTFPNACKKLEEEKKIASKINKNNTNEDNIRKKLKEFKKNNTNSKVFQLRIFLIILIIIFFICSFLIFTNEYKNQLFIVNGIILTFILILQYIIANINLKDYK